MNSSGVLLFTNDSGGGAASSGYVNDEFLDTVLPPTNNIGFSSTLARNPLGTSFGNDLSTKWMSKTLYIKDLVQVQDRSKWISNRPTYSIVWNETFPGVGGYAFGNLQVDGTSERRRLLLSSVGDGFGVGGIIRRVVWLLQPISGTGTCAQSIDGTGGVTHTFGGASTVSSIGQKPSYIGYVSGSTNQTRDIHDYRITANQANTLAVYGAIVYFEVAGSGIDVNPGVQYQNKAAITVPVGSTLAFPGSVGSLNGGKAGVYVTNTGGVGFTTTLQPEVSANGIGTINTNLINLNTGSGTSFIQGSALFLPTATTHYLGLATSVSGDVLTVAPTLPFGVSNLCSIIFQAGYTFAISSTLHQESFNFNASFAEQALNASFIFEGATGTGFQYNYFDPEGKYAVWGPSLIASYGSSVFSGLGNTLGLRFIGQSMYIQVDGRFSALEAEFIVGNSASLNYTLAIDGLANVAFNENVAGQGIIRRTIMTNGQFGNHSVRISHGAGGTQTLLTRLIGYEPRFRGETLGLLAEIPVYGTFIIRNSLSSTQMALGNVQRKYIQQLYATPTGWTGAAADSGGVPGGNLAISSATNDRISFSYFGTRCAVLGATFASLGIVIDGANGGSQLNTWLGSGLTLGFHSLVITNLGAATSLRVSAIDFLSPVGEVKSLANFSSFADQDKMPRVFQGAMEPQGARTGDIWEQEPTNKVAFQKLFGGWQRIGAGMVGAAYGSTTSQLLPSGSYVNLSTMDVQLYDPDRVGIQGATFAFRIPSDGDYLIGTQVSFQNNASGIRQLDVEVVGTGDAARTYLVLASRLPIGAFNDVLAGVVPLFGMKAGHIVIPRAFQNTGGDLNINGSAINSYAWIRRI